MILDILKNNLTPSDEFIFGTCNLSGLIDKKYGEYKYGISIGKKLDDKIVDKIKNGPTLEYFNHYQNINKELSVTAIHIQEKLAEIGINSIITEPTMSTSSKEFQKFLKTLTVDVSHKMVATRSGLGWIGKTDLFISKKFGPRLRLVSLLIDQKPENFSAPIEENRCGNCRICVDRCPAKAANGLPWNINTHRDAFFDAHKCRNKCGELAKQKLKVDKRICGLCVAVCPIGRKM